MSYAVKEIYYTLQGEGAQAGRPAVFCRFSGCNLWSGKEQEKAESTCWFCDTDFVGTDGPGGGKFATAKELALALRDKWTPSNGVQAFVVFTGGEPLLQLDKELIQEVKRQGFQIAVETNGTIKAPEGIDWLTVSPKPDCRLEQTSGNELKLLYPLEVSPKIFEEFNFEEFYLSPIKLENQAESQQNMEAAVEFCKANPKWKITMQYHKIWGLP